MPATLVTEWSQYDGLDTTFTKAAPLPRLTALPPVAVSPSEKRYEVLVVGAGPSGLMMTTLLTRYGLPPPHSFALTLVRTKRLSATLMVAKAMGAKYCKFVPSTFVIPLVNVFLRDAPIYNASKNL